MDNEMLKAVNAFYDTYAELYKRCGDSSLAIRLTCAICGIKVPESENLLFSVRSLRKP